MTDRENAADRTAAAYRFWVEDQVRFADLDPLGHCNSAVFSSFFESARVALLAAVGHAPGDHGRSFAIVRQTIEYHQELKLGARLRIGTRVTKLGRTSVTLANAVFEGERCAATAEVVGVLLSIDAHRPVELPPDLRAALARYA